MKKFAFHFFTLLFFLALLTATYFEREIGPLAAFLAVIVSSIMYKVRNKKTNAVNIILYLWICMAIANGVKDHNRYIPEMIYILIAYIAAIMNYREYDPSPKSNYPEGVKDFFKQGGGD